MATPAPAESVAVGPVAVETAVGPVTVPEMKAVAPLRAVAPVVVEAPVVEPAVVEPVAVEAAPEPARRAVKKAPATPELDGEVRFVPWAPRSGGERKALDSLDDPRAARTVKRVLTAGVKAEGPVHRDRLTRLTAGAFGLTRVSEARRDALLALLPAHTLDGEFVWPGTFDRNGWTTFRRQAASADRPLEHVAPQEVGNAMVALCRAAAGMTDDELFLRTAEVFGYRRRTPSLTPLLEAALTRLLDAGRLTRQEAGLLTAP